MDSVLIFLEDPGAVNFFRSLPNALESFGLKTNILATGLAASLLEGDSILFEQPSNTFNCQKYLLETNCKIALLGTSDNRDSLSFSLIEECKLLGIPTVAGIDMAVNSSERFRGISQNPIRYLPDWLFVADSHSQKAFENLGVQEARIKIVGHPHFDKVMEFASSYSNAKKAKLRQCLFPTLDSELKLITFLCQPDTDFVTGQMFKSKEYSLKGWGKTECRSEIVIEELIDALKPYRSEILFGLRLHPKNNVEQYQKYKTKIDFFNFGGNPLEVLLVSDVIIGMSTMLLSESVLMSKPTFSILPRIEEKEWLPGLIKDEIPVVSTRQDLRRKIQLLFSEGLKSIDLEKKISANKGADQKMVDLVRQIIGENAVRESFL